MPPHEIEDNTKNIVQQYTINISAKERALMQELVDKYEHVMVFTDGCSLENPGKSGAAASFYGVLP